MAEDISRPSPPADDARRWDSAYAEGDLQKSWYQEHAETSLDLIRRWAGDGASVLDVGGGASTLVDDLLAAGFPAPTVLDVSEAGLRIARDRLGDAAGAVRWIVADLRTWTPDTAVDAWHDRAVLHFLTDEDDRAAYRAALLGATEPGSHAVIGVFGPEGPLMCSGSTVRRYSAADMADFLGAAFEVKETFEAIHRTPWGAEQQFLWTAALRVG